MKWAAWRDVSMTSEQEIALRHRKLGRRLAGQEAAVGAPFLRLGVGLDARHGGIMPHALRGNRAGSGDRHQLTAEAELPPDVALQCRGAGEGDGADRRCAAEGREHWAIVLRLRRW